MWGFKGKIEETPRQCSRTPGQTSQAAADTEIIAQPAAGAHSKGGFSCQNNQRTSMLTSR